jgi:8-oxo-dGTP diphosphatase
VSRAGPARPGLSTNSWQDRRVPQAVQDIQRVAAYGLVQRDARLLLVQLTARTPAAGAWSLPGGGIDHGEDPVDAVIRELYEETGLHGRVRELLDVSSHFREHYLDQEVLERYHAVRILYRVEVDADGPLTVIDADGSSDSPTWFALDEVRELRLTPIAARGLKFVAG